MTEFPAGQPAEHPTGFPVESEPENRPDPETEPGSGGEPDFDSEPDRGALPETLAPGNDPVDEDTGSPWDERVVAGAPDDAQVDALPEPFDEPSDEPVDLVDEAEVEGGGHPVVGETVARLAGLRDRPVSEHAEVYADLQERLQAALAEADRTDAERSDTGERV